MLRKETVTTEILELLKRLMQDRGLSSFVLVGGTALALQIAHRRSIDIDLFSKKAFNETELSAYLKATYKFTLDFTAKNTLKGEINGIKVDLITHSYPDIIKPSLIEGVRMASLEDIAAMKLNAIIGSGSRVKDFVDVAYLSSHLSLKNMIQAYAAKYSENNSIMPLKALNFHNDVNFKEPVQLLESGFNWDLIALRLREMTKDPDKTFALIKMTEDKINVTRRVKRRR